MADWVSREAYDSLQREYQLALARAAELQVSIDDAVKELRSLIRDTTDEGAAGEASRVIALLTGEWKDENG